MIILLGLTALRSFAYAAVQPNVTIAYTGTGSGAGQTAIKANVVNFAGSDAPLADSVYVTVRKCSYMIDVFIEVKRSLRSSDMLVSAPSNFSDDR